MGKNSAGIWWQNLNSQPLLYPTAKPLLPKEGLAEFLRRCDQAELNAHDDLGTVRQAQNASLRLLERRAKRLGASESEIRKFMLGLLDGAL